MSVGRGVLFKKTRTDECLRLDMIDLTSKYIMDWDWKVSMSWTSSWGRYDSIGIDIIPPNKIRLYYTQTKRSTGQSTKLDYITYYESTPCYYGGKRYWFICPACYRRCRILYLPPGEKYFACRICHNLTYESQQEGRNSLWPLFAAITEYPDLQKKLNRTRSPRKRARIEKKMQLIYDGMIPLAYPNRKRRGRRKK